MNGLELASTVAGVLLVLGALLKRAVPDEWFSSRWIPLILCAVGTPLHCALAGTWTAAAICMGLLNSAQAIGLHQIAKQTSNSSI